MSRQYISASCRGGAAGRHFPPGFLIAGVYDRFAERVLNVMLCLVTKSSLRVRRTLTKDEAEAEAVRSPMGGRWTAGLALAVLGEARTSGLWLRCDCRVENDLHPLAAPCRLPDGAGYTCRVLQGGERPQHHLDCVFYRESRHQRAERKWRQTARVRPTGYFAALHAREDGKGLTEPGHGQEEAGGKEPGQRRVSALSRLLCWLMEEAGLTRIWANEPDPDVEEWLEAIRDTATAFEIAPDQGLEKLLFLSRTDWDRRRVHARVREAAWDFSAAHVAQGFVCFPVHRIGDTEIPAGTGYQPLEVVSRIKRPTIGRHDVSGPYLFFGVVGLTTRRRGYECVQAWAQPIVSVRRAVPVDSSLERWVFGTLTTTLRILDHAFPDAEFHIEKPVFEVGTARGPCLPDFLIRARRKGEERTYVVEVMGFEPGGLSLRQGGHARADGRDGSGHPHGREGVSGSIDGRGPQGDATHPCRPGTGVAVRRGAAAQATVAPWPARRVVGSPHPGCLLSL